MEEGFKEILASWLIGSRQTNDRQISFRDRRNNIPVGARNVRCDVLKIDFWPSSQGQAGSLTIFEEHNRFALRNRSGFPKICSANCLCCLFWIYKGIVEQAQA